MTSFGWGSRNHALGALGLNVLLLGALASMVAVIDFVPLALGEELVEVSQKLAGLTTVGTIVGAFGFLPWLSKTYERASAVASTPELEEQRRRGPVASFFIPVLNFFRPYRAVRVLDDALDPDRVPLAAPRLDPDGMATYREPAPVAVIERRPAPSAPVAVWWGLWIARAFGALVTRRTESNMVIAAWDAIVCGAAIAACVVVWRIDARLREVERRQQALADAQP